MDVRGVLAHSTSQLPSSAMGDGRSPPGQIQRQQELELGMGGWVLQLLRLQLGAGSLDAGRCSNIDGITILAATAAAAWHLQRRRHE
jgi:hypothetical protein